MARRPSNDLWVELLGERAARALDALERCRNTGDWGDYMTLLTVTLPDKAPFVQAIVSWETNREKGSFLVAAALYGYPTLVHYFCEAADRVWTAYTGVPGRVRPMWQSPSFWNEREDAIKSPIAFEDVFAAIADRESRGVSHGFVFVRPQDMRFASMPPDAYPPQTFVVFPDGTRYPGSSTPIRRRILHDLGDAPLGPHDGSVWYVSSDDRYDAVARACRHPWMNVEIDDIDATRMIFVERPPRRDLRLRKAALTVEETHTLDVLARSGIHTFEDVVDNDHRSVWHAHDDRFVCMPLRVVWPDELASAGSCGVCERELVLSETIADRRDEVAFLTHRSPVHIICAACFRNSLDPRDRCGVRGCTRQIDILESTRLAAASMLTPELKELVGNMPVRIRDGVEKALELMASPELRQREGQAILVAKDQDIDRIVSAWDPTRHGPLVRFGDVLGGDRSATILMGLDDGTTLMVEFLGVQYIVLACKLSLNVIAIVARSLDGSVGMLDLYLT